MDWANLFSGARYTNRRFDINPVGLASSFLTPYSRDPERVQFSSSFRRLQGKTQVFMFPQSDFIRNRLTHTLEVSSIGRNLALGIIRELRPQNQKHSFYGQDIDPNDILDIVSAACLAHDLGNPPFGHVGEYAIRSWFIDMKSSSNKILVNLLDGQHGSDFVYFDGNAQSFRCVTRLQGWGYSKGGLRLTAATQGALVKYPNKSSIKSRYSNKEGKFGFYKEEERLFEQLSDNLGLRAFSDGNFARHPLAYITEAADDIAYLTSDIEDARKAGMISYDEAIRQLDQVARTLRGFDPVRVEKINSEKGRLRFLRSAAVLALIQHCIYSFADNVEKIREGAMEGSLLQNSEAKPLENALREMSEKKIYFQNKKTRAEAGAYEVIRNILTIFSEALTDKLSNNSRATERSINILRMISQNGSGIANEKIHIKRIYF